MISKEEVGKLAGLARIQMADEELEALRGELDQIVEFVSQVQKADVSSVPELPMPEHRNVWREDGIPHETGVYTDSIVANFPDKKGDYLRVKKILDNK